MGITSALPHTQPYLFECICLHNIEETLSSVVSHANIYRCAVGQLKCTAALVWAECIPHCSVLLCKTDSQQTWVIAISPMEIRSSYRCAVVQLKCTAALIKAKCISHWSVVLCKTGSQQACVTAIAPTDICSPYRCAVGQLKCTATLVWAKCISHCQCCSANQAHSRHVSEQFHLRRLAFHAGVQWAN